jgi:hypothetical protein
MADPMETSGTVGIDSDSDKEDGPEKVWNAAPNKVSFVDHMWQILKTQPTTFLHLLPRELFAELLHFALSNQWEDCGQSLQLAMVNKQLMRIMSVLCFPERKRIVIGMNRARIVELDFNLVVQRVASNPTGVSDIWHMVHSPPYFLAGCPDGNLLIFHAEEFRHLQCVNILQKTEYQNDVMNLRMLCDRLVTAGDNHLCVWDLASRTIVVDLRLCPAYAWALTTCGTQLYCPVRANKRDGNTWIGVWSGLDWSLVRKIELEPSMNIRSLFVTESAIFAGSGEGHLIFLDPTGKELRRATAGSRSLAGLTVRGNLLISVCDEGSISLWNWRTGERVRQLMKAHSGDINCVAMADDAFFTVSDDSTVKMWRLFL